MRTFDDGIIDTKVVREYTANFKMIKVPDQFLTTTSFLQLRLTYLHATQCQSLISVDISWLKSNVAKMSVAKLTTRFRLRAYSCDTIINYGNQVFLVL